ncbi:MAG: lipoate--protein ligase family protein, partial [Calditrichaeota bacterium]
MSQNQAMKLWRYIEEDGVSAHEGLAADEALLAAYGRQEQAAMFDGTLRLYTYRAHCALVGRFQNLSAEINLDYCRKHDIQVSRRPTGGGAILMGPAQLGVCAVISTHHRPELANPVQAYHYFAAPLIHALRALGIQAAFRPKNDLEVGGRKIAGLGVYYDPHGALLFHASLLVDLDIALMLRVLNIPGEKYRDRVMIRSVRQRLTTVSRELGQPLATDQVRRQVAAAFEQVLGIQLQDQPFGPAEKEAIAALARRKYLSPDWLYLQSPNLDMTGTAVKKTPLGLLRIYIALAGRTIKSVLIAGDYFDFAQTFRHLEGRL